MSSMYLDRYRFLEEPFRLTPDPKYFFSGEQYERVLMELRYGIEQRKGFMVLTGEVGTGKTTVCRTLMDSLDPAVRTALILNPSLTVEELLYTVVQDFGLPMPSLIPTKKELLDTLNRFLLESALEGGGAVVIVDEAQNLTSDLLEELRLLTNLETDREKLLQILLIGQPELAEKLATTRLRQLRQRVAVWASLESLDRDDTGAYIRKRIDVASGAVPRVRFTSQAIRKIQSRAAGIPRTINLVCDRALMLVYMEDSDVVTARMITQASREVLQPLSGSFATRSKTLITAAAAAFLTLVLLPAGDGHFTEPVFLPAQAEEPVSMPIGERTVSELMSQLLIRQGYEGPGIEVLSLILNGDNVRQLERSFRSTGLSESSSLRTAVIPIEHSLWLKVGSTGIVDASDGSMLLVEPKWGRGREWRILDRIEGSKTQDGRAAWDGALIAYRPIPGLEVPLGKGDKGEQVKVLQEALSKMELLTDSMIDGIYGARTAAAIVLVQKQCSLDPTGHLDDETAYYLTRFSEIRN